MRRKLSFLIITVAILAGLWLAMRPDTAPANNAEVAAQTQTVNFDIVSGSTPAPQIIRLKIGDTAQLNFVSDTDAAVHVHGVDMHIPLTAGIKEQREFVATQAGRFSLEVHDTEMQLGTIEVYPR